MAAFALTTHATDAIAKHLFSAATWTPPGTWYLAAFTTPPTRLSGGTEAVGYTRKAISTSNMTFAGTGTGRYANSGIVTFTDLPDDTYVGVGLFDALTVGNMWLFAQLAVNKTTTDGTLPFPIGNLIIGFT